MVVLTRLQAVPLSVLTSPFTIDAQSQLQPDPSDETTALLRVLIHEAEKPAFGKDVPTVPQWTDPPHAIVLAQAILYAVLATSLHIPRDARQAMVESIHFHRYAWDPRRSQLEPQRRRHRRVVLRPCDDDIAVGAASCPAVPF